MITIGITGGIGSGKSVISKILICKGIPVYDTDSKAKELMNSSDEIKKGLVDLLGEDSYKNNIINKNYISEKIFNNKHLLSETNKIIHPVVFNDFISWAKEKKTDIVFCESAILFESNMQNILDYTITVNCPEELRIKRACERDKCERDKIISRIRNQRDDNYRTSLASFCINNDGTESIIKQIGKILDEIKKQSHLKIY